jgi:hypothetical protein
MADLSLLIPSSDDADDSNPNNFYSRFRSTLAVVAASPRMSHRDRENLNPCEKLRKYGRIPWKLTVHCALALLSTLMVYIWTENDALHIRHSSMHFRQTLLGVSGNDREIQVSSSADLKQSLDTAIEAFWSIGGTNLTDYSVCKGPLEFTVMNFARTGERKSHILLFESSWRDDPTYQELTTSVDSTLRSMVVRGVVHDKFEGRFWHQCLRWTLDTEFKYGGTGMVVGTVGYGLTECSKDGDSESSIPLIVILMATVSIILCTKAYFKQSDKKKWFAFNVLSNIVQILGALACMRITRRMDIDLRFSLLGLSAISAWISLVRYLRFFHIYYVLIRTLAHAVPQCIRFVTGVAPILLGYALLGTCLFYQSVMFTTIGDSLATLFSLLNGDIIRDSFTELGFLMPFWGHVYLYSFLCLFIYVVLHIFISIVEESYFNSRQRQQRADARFHIDEEEPQMVELTSTEHPKDIREHVLARVCEDIALLRRDHEFWKRARHSIGTYLA